MSSLPSCMHQGHLTSRVSMRAGLRLGRSRWRPGRARRWQRPTRSPRSQTRRRRPPRRARAGRAERALLHRAGRRLQAHRRPPPGRGASSPCCSHNARCSQMVTETCVCSIGYPSICLHSTVLPCQSRHRLCGESTQPASLNLHGRAARYAGRSWLGGVPWWQPAQWPYA